MIFAQKSFENFLSKIQIWIILVFFGHFYLKNRFLFHVFEAFLTYVTNLPSSFLRHLLIVYMAIKQLI